MCGIFGVISHREIRVDILQRIAGFIQQRGRDSSGLLYHESNQYHLRRASGGLVNLLGELKNTKIDFIMGHSRLVTNGMADNQPIYRDSVCVIHNGIVVNHTQLWGKTAKKRFQEIDTEIIAALAADTVDEGRNIAEIAQKVLSNCDGIVACAIAIPKLGKICLFSNNGSLYCGKINNEVWFASEKYPLLEIDCSEIEQIKNAGIVFEIPKVESDPIIKDTSEYAVNLIPSLGKSRSEEAMLMYNPRCLKRCTKCILPETMPFIKFDKCGVCNYCNNYKPRNKPRPIDELFKIVNPYRRVKAADCIIPFSGGRDSCYALHLASKVLKLNPITYTYDWGMVTDLGRRNISRMCSRLGVENIIVAADISKKRKNIQQNLLAWLKSPNLGMVSILTAGDKHFFKHVETVKRQTGISLNLWGINPLEVTHFKAGFLGIPPDFEEKLVYSHGVMKQIRYQALRLEAMLASPGYFNSSLWDTLSGEYYRSFTDKSDYYHAFDYCRWDEKQIDTTLIGEYDWEVAPDTKTTWRIGDGTAAIYNYIYYTVAGFTEHDTFRSNQIREGDLTREEALMIVEEENRPRYPNLKWYLDAIGLDFSAVIGRINQIQPIETLG